MGRRWRQSEIGRAASRVQDQIWDLDTKWYQVGRRRRAHRRLMDELGEFVSLVANYHNDLENEEDE